MSLSNIVWFEGVFPQNHLLFLKIKFSCGFKYLISEFLKVNWIRVLKKSKFSNHFKPTKCVNVSRTLQKTLPKGTLWKWPPCLLPPACSPRPGQVQWEATGLWLTKPRCLSPTCLHATCWAGGRSWAPSSQFTLPSVTLHGEWDRDQGHAAAPSWAQRQPACLTQSSKHSA